MNNTKKELFYNKIIYIAFLAACLSLLGCGEEKVVVPEWAAGSEDRIGDSEDQLMLPELEETDEINFIIDILDRNYYYQKATEDSPDYAKEFDITSQVYEALQEKYDYLKYGGEQLDYLIPLYRSDKVYSLDDEEIHRKIVERTATEEEEEKYFNETRGVRVENIENAVADIIRNYAYRVDADGYELYLDINVYDSDYDDNITYVNRQTTGWAQDEYDEKYDVTVEIKLMPQDLLNILRDCDVIRKYENRNLFSSDKKLREMYRNTLIRTIYAYIKYLDWGYSNEEFRFEIIKIEKKPIDDEPGTHVDPNHKFSEFEIYLD